MSYDELEDQYFLLIQKAKDLERKNNELELMVIELEAEKAIVENQLRSSEEKNQALKQTIVEEQSKVVHLNFMVDSLKNSAEKLQDQVKKANNETVAVRESSIVKLLEDPYKFQQIIHPNASMLHAHSVHRPMGMWDGPTHDFITLRKIDVMSYHVGIDRHYYQPQMHVMCSCDGSIIRYANQSFLKEEPADFAVCLDQMINAFKLQIARTYFDERKFK